MENARTRMRAAFEFMSKLGIRHYTFHDVYVSYTFLHFYYSRLVYLGKRFCWYIVGIEILSGFFTT